MNEYLIFYSILLLPVFGMISIPFIPGAGRAKYTSVFVIIVAIFTSYPALKVLAGKEDFVVQLPALIDNFSWRIDALSAWFILIINITCISGALYGSGYMKSYEDRRHEVSLHWILFLLFQSSMLWVCVVHYALAFLIVWELMSISSFLLVIFDYRQNTTLQAGIHYLVQMHIGVLFFAAAFIWVYITTGSLEFAAIAQFFSAHSNIWLFFLFFTGFAIKAGFIPLHSWLPQAHPAAPSHVSGVMSGVIVKLGIYGILRIIFLLRQDYSIIGEIILVLSVATGLFGILNAAVHRDFKRMLAYCTIENIGIIGMGIGLGLTGIGLQDPAMVILGFGSALLHIFNHSLFKSLLFFSAGSVYQQTHTRDMEKLGGLIRTMPQTALLFLLGSLAIGGLPPFNGFISEFILFNGFLKGFHSPDILNTILIISALAGLAVIGGVSMLTFTKSFGVIFLGQPRTQLHVQPKEVSAVMRMPLYGILVLMLSVGLFPQFYFSIVSNILTRLVYGSPIGESFIPWSMSHTAVYSRNSTYVLDLFYPEELLNSLAGISHGSLVFVAFLLIIYFVRRQALSRRKVAVASTWGCGYPAPNVSMQYTGKSYSKSLGKLLNFILREKKKYTEIAAGEIFPQPRRHSSHYTDFFESLLINPFVDRLLYTMNYFRFIQNGRTQAYLLYGIFFISLIFFGSIFNLI